MNKAVLVKLGGSLITEKSKPFTERPDVINRLAGEIHQARQESGMTLVVGHGGGSYPHKPAADYKTQAGVKDRDSYRGIALVQDEAARLNRIVVEALIKSGENAMTIQPSAASLSENGRLMEWFTGPLERLLEYGMLPVVYGDVGLDTGRGCCILSTEELFRFLAGRLGVSRVIMCGKTDGVFTSDPARDSSASHIPEITRENFSDVRGYLSDSDGIDVTGGMLHKIEQALEMARNGVSTEIINGNRHGNLRAALLGKKVSETLIH